MSGQVQNISGSFADRLRTLMLEQELGAERLGALSKISPRLINKYRAGSSEPRNSFGSPTPNAYKLARALGVEVDVLLPPRQRDREVAA